MVHSLPPELWREILRDATHVPFLLETEWRYNPDDCLWAGWEPLNPELNPEIREEITSSNTTKRAIVSVCRAWKEIGLEYLYESIDIPIDVDRLVHLVDIMRQSVSDSYAGHGWWTKRIGWNGRELGSESLGTVTSLFELCHHVQILVLVANTIPASMRVTLAHMIQSRFPHSLRRFEILTHNQEELNTAVRYADTLPNVHLTALSLTARTSVPDHPFHPHFENISTFTIYLPGSVNDLPNQWYLPNLRHLTIDNFNQEDVPALLPFVQRHHQTLTYLHLLPTNRECEIPFLCHQAPNIRSLTFPFNHLRHLRGLAERDQGKGPNFSGVTHIGIIKPGEMEYMSIGSAMEDLLRMGMFPDLVMLRIFHHETWSERESRIHLNTALQRHGIRVIAAPGYQLG